MWWEQHSHHTALAITLAAPHNHTLLGPPRLPPLLGVRPGSVRCAGGASRRQPAAPLSAGHCHRREGREGRGKAHHAFPLVLLRHYCFYPHHQGNTEREADGGCPRTLTENVTFNIRDKSSTRCSYYLRTNCFGYVIGFQLASQADVVALSAAHPRSQQHARLCELPDGRKWASALHHEAHRGQPRDWEPLLHPVPWVSRWPGAHPQRPTNQ